MTATPPRSGDGWQKAMSTGGGRWGIAAAALVAAFCFLAGSWATALTLAAQLGHPVMTTAQIGADAKDPGAPGSAARNPGNNGKAPGQPGPGDGSGDLNALPGQLHGISHGEISQPVADQQAVTLLVQIGQVLTMDGQELTVRSADGFTETYTSTSQTAVRGPAKANGFVVGSEVTVVALKDGKRMLLVTSKGVKD